VLKVEIAPEASVIFSFYRRVIVLGLTQLRESEGGVAVIYFKVLNNYLIVIYNFNYFIAKVDIIL
jgi:hypothetical protein